MIIRMSVVQTRTQFKVLSVQLYGTAISAHQFLSCCGRNSVMRNIEVQNTIALGPVVRKPINANPRLKVNRGLSLARY